MQYKTKKQAESALLDHITVRRFCPLINEDCKAECVCYNNAEAKHNEIHDYWYLCGGVCENRMLRGRI